ncbi:MAG: site-specific integrase, partial [Alphaproteobacteria bacterium]|nr:site-specific integrase [Alphaproteobacteria bacterium]
MAASTGIESAVPSLTADDPALDGALQAWQRWLSDERRFSPHTCASYARDLEAFIRFMTEHLGGPPTMEAMLSLKAGDFRAWLARQATAGRQRSSVARALSVVRGFFAWLERNGHGANHAIRAVRTPKIPHAVPKALSIGEAADTVASAGDLAVDSMNDWLALRDIAMLTLLYGAGLRI